VRREDSPLNRNGGREKGRGERNVHFGNSLQEKLGHHGGRGGRPGGKNAKNVQGRAGAPHTGHEAQRNILFLIRWRRTTRKKGYDESRETGCSSGKRNTRITP